MNHVGNIMGNIMVTHLGNIMVKLSQHVTEDMRKG